MKLVYGSLKYYVRSVTPPAHKNHPRPKQFPTTTHALPPRACILVVEFSYFLVFRTPIDVRNRDISRPCGIIRDGELASWLPAPLGWSMPTPFDRWVSYLSIHLKFHPSEPHQTLHIDVDLVKITPVSHHVQVLIHKAFQNLQVILSLVEPLGRLLDTNSNERCNRFGLFAIASVAAKQDRLDTTFIREDLFPIRQNVSGQLVGCGTQ
jgi:hypothetical protein